MENGHPQLALQRFEEIAEQLPDLLKTLLNSKPHHPEKRTSLQGLCGVYLFSESGQHLYVGRTKNAWQRIGQHYWESSGHNSAALAFNLAKKLAGEAGHQLVGTREQIAAHPDFVPFFDEAKGRVSQMEVRFVEMSDPVLSTIFEVYVSLALETEGGFNLFDTH